MSKRDPPRHEASPIGSSQEDAQLAGNLFSQLFKRESPPLKNYVATLVGNREDAEEIAQEAFSRVYAARSELRSPKAVLYEAARNIVIDKNRRARKHRELFAEEGDMNDVADPSPSPEAQVESRRRLERLRSVLDALPERFRIVLLLQTIDGFSYAEIARALGISMPTVKKRLRRALELCASIGAAQEAEQRARNGAGENGS